MMSPSIEELSQGIYNRYELVIAVAKCARKLTDIENARKEEPEQVNIRELFDKGTGKRESSDDKSVKLAIKKIYEQEYVIHSPHQRRKSQS